MVNISKRLLGTAALGLALLLPGCSRDLKSSESSFAAPKRSLLTRPSADARKLQSLIHSLNSFSLKLYADVAQSKSGNLAVSPIGSFLLLEMLYEGSSGAAHEESGLALGCQGSGIAEAALLLWQLNDQPSLLVAQKIYVDARAQIMHSWTERVQPLMGDAVETVPFATNPEEAAEIINKWVSEQTGGLIEQAISPSSEQTVCVLVSTLHFHGQWAHEFAKENTRPRDFRGADGTVSKVSMMRMDAARLDLFTVEGGQAVVLPYTDETEMILLLPNPGVAPDSLWKNLNPRQRLGKNPPREPLVNLELPRFGFEVPTFDLTENWKHAGLAHIVSGADLSPMLKLSNIDTIDSTVFQQTSIKVDEKGTDAAAATVAIATPAAAATPERVPEVTISFNRPFSFFLRHSKSGAILMMGRVEQPEKS